MKKYLPGILAILMAFSAFAFTEKPFNKNNTKFSEPCSESAKKWFIISLTCSQQTDVTVIRNPLNYIPPPVTSAVARASCAGTECVCAIWACPVTINSQVYPIINSNCSIFSSLTNFFDWGTTSSDILTKDDGTSSRKRR